MSGRSKGKITKREFVKAYKETFSTEAGQIVLADMVKRGRVLSPFPMNKRNAGDMDFCEGQRQFVLATLSLVNYDLSKLDELIEQFKTEVTYDGQSTTA